MDKTMADWTIVFLLVVFVASVFGWGPADSADAKLIAVIFGVLTVANIAFEVMVRHTTGRR